MVEGRPKTGNGWLQNLVRNRNLQGLGAAILKLWEKKSLIAKTAIKWGIQNTDNEQMAYELKNLTEGVLLLRNKFLIMFYAGKDFLPQGTLSEFQDIQAKFGDLENENNELEIQLQAERENLERELRNQERKLSILNVKMEKSAKQLAKLNSSWQPAEQDVDLEIITEEERECLRKIGLKLNCCLVLDRRGIFNGIIEGVHQHWKHREVVKSWKFFAISATTGSLGFEAQTGKNRERLLDEMTLIEENSSHCLAMNVFFFSNHFEDHHPVAINIRLVGDPNVETLMQKPTHGTILTWEVLLMLAISLTNCSPSDTPTVLHEVHGAGDVEVTEVQDVASEDGVAVLEEPSVVDQLDLRGLQGLGIY
ncbi:hypothetical protein PTKIN_Ptkin10aG0199700 [Pterospermum kingtungense]